MQNTTTNARFEDRVIAFIDVLGAKELISDEKQKVRFLNMVLEFSREVREGRSEEKSVPNSDRWFPLNLRGIAEIIDNGNTVYHEDFDVAAFSDHIVISFRYKQDDLLPKKIRALFREVQRFCNGAFSQGILLRGAITNGELYHKGSVIAGDALVTAYTLEEKCAIYPRIIITGDILPIALQHMSYDIYCSDDGLHYLHWMGSILQWNAELEGVEDENGNIVPEETGQGTIGLDENSALDAKKTIEACIIKYNDNLRILQKWQWLADYYNKIIRNYDDGSYRHLLINSMPYKNPNTSP
jgi:hypothetical protein